VRVRIERQPVNAEEDEREVEEEGEGEEMREGEGASGDHHFGIRCVARWLAKAPIISNVPRT
jgi:hypothetical protein